MKSDLFSARKVNNKEKNEEREWDFLGYCFFSLSLFFFDVNLTQNNSVPNLVF